MCLVVMVQLYEVEQEVTSVSSVQFIIRGSSAYLLEQKNVFTYPDPISLF